MFGKVIIGRHERHGQPANSRLKNLVGPLSLHDLFSTLFVSVCATYRDVLFCFSTGGGGVEGPSWFFCVVRFGFSCWSVFFLEKLRAN